MECSNAQKCAHASMGTVHKKGTGFHHGETECFSPGRYKPLSPPMATSVIPKYDRWT